MKLQCCVYKATQTFLTGDWGYTPEGVLDEIFFVRIYVQKAAPGLQRGKKRRL